MFSIPDDADWSQVCRDMLSRYSDRLLRTVAARLIRPRVNQALDEVLDKSIGMLTNPPVIDRRVRDLPEASRKLLGLIGKSHQPRWKVGHLMALLATLGFDEGFTPVEEALQAGLLYPQVPHDLQPLDNFTDWLGRAGPLSAEVFTHPAVARRARMEELGLPNLASENRGSQPIRQADGLDWPLRFAALWQSVRATPVRHTQTNTLFKKDLNRLQSDELLTAPWPGEAVSQPDIGVLALLWATAASLLRDVEGELSAGPFPSNWESDLNNLLGSFFAALPNVEYWDPLSGYTPLDIGLSATPTAGFITLLLLAQAEPRDWIDPSVIADWLWTHHPNWAASIPKSETNDRGAKWIANWLFAIAYPLQLIEVSDDLVRLTALGRFQIGSGPHPTAPQLYPQTLLVQPNAEIIAYRQGLIPSLIATLSRFAQWKSLGPACTLELSAEQTYWGLESGLTLAMMVQALSRHASRPIPPAVVDLLQRWASKRERITVFTSAVLVEFATAGELDTALSRGIVGVRLTDRIGMTADGTEPALAQLRLIANRDYEAKPQRCVSISDDGVTLIVDAAAADLLLDAEIGRFALPAPSDPSVGRQFYMTSELLRRAGESLSIADIDTWFLERTGEPLSPAGRLLLLGPMSGPLTAARLLVVRFPDSQMTDGAMQWPKTRALIAERLGPTCVAVAEEHLSLLRDVMDAVGIRME